MARYLARVATPLSVETTFDKLADLSRFSEWDPGVLHGRCVRQTADGVGSIYELMLDAPFGRPWLRYMVDRFERAPQGCVIGFSGSINGLTSVDEMRVATAAEGTVATYDAALTARFRWALCGCRLNVYFRRLGDRAAFGLRRFLGGSAVAGDALERGRS